MLFTGEPMAITDRMVRASKGDISLYEEVEHDPGATTEALMVIIATAISMGLGSAVGSAISRTPGGPIGNLIGNLVGSVIGWLVFSGVVYLVGKNMFNADATWEEVLRTTG